VMAYSNKKVAPITMSITRQHILTNHKKQLSH